MMPAWKADAEVKKGPATWVHRLRLIPPRHHPPAPTQSWSPARTLAPQSTHSTAARRPASTRIGFLSFLLCPPPSWAPVSLRVKCPSRPSPPEAHKALCSLPRPLPLFPLLTPLQSLWPPPCSLTGRVWSCPCPRAFAHATPSGTLPPPWLPSHLLQDSAPYNCTPKPDPPSRALPAFFLSAMHPAARATLSHGQPPTRPHDFLSGLEGRRASEAAAVFVFVGRIRGLAGPGCAVGWASVLTSMDCVGPSSGGMGGLRR